MVLIWYFMHGPLRSSLVPGPPNMLHDFTLTFFILLFLLFCPSSVYPSFSRRVSVLTRSLALSLSGVMAGGSTTIHFSVTGWSWTPLSGSRIFTLTSSFPPVAFLPSSTLHTDSTSLVNHIFVCLWCIDMTRILMSEWYFMSEKHEWVCVYNSHL